MRECFTFYPHDPRALGILLTWLQLFAVAGRQFGCVTVMPLSTIEFACVKHREGIVRELEEGTGAERQQTSERGVRALPLKGNQS